MRGAPTSALKKALRSEALVKRRALRAPEAQSWSRSVQARALDLAAYRASESVGLYNAIENEVRTEAIRDDALASGKRAFYPRIEPDDSLELVQMSSTDGFKPGRMGILEPFGNSLFHAEAAAGFIVFVPGVAFDEQGNRLGHGKGYYDSLLRRLRGAGTFAALAYEFQIVETVPTDSWDQRVDFIVTERRIIDCAGSAADCVETR